MTNTLRDSISAVQHDRILRLERDMRAIAEIAECHAEPEIHMIAVRAINNAPEIDVKLLKAKSCGVD